MTINPSIHSTIYRLKSDERRKGRRHFSEYRSRGLRQLFLIFIPSRAKTKSFNLPLSFPVIRKYNDDRNSYPSFPLYESCFTIDPILTMLWSGGNPEAVKYARKLKIRGGGRRMEGFIIRGSVEIYRPFQTLTRSNYTGRVQQSG